MLTETVKVGRDLDAEGSAKFVQKACRYNSNIKLTVGVNSVNAKSMLGVMNIGIVDGKTVVIEASGEDDKQAVSELGRILRG